MIARRLLPLALAALTPALTAQMAPRPQPYCVRGVFLDRSGTTKGTLVLRDGSIEAVLDEAAPAPPGTRVIDGAGLYCLPAFLDAYSRLGVTVPKPVKDQDLPPNEQADVGVDMRLANRNGIQPAFRAVEALAITKDQGEAWRKSGFGAVLVAPGGELLSGTSALATTREAAMRDVVLRRGVFAHAAFAASGPGYPSTLMGYFAQLRQFLLDSRRQVELARRYEQGRPGPRPPFDAELEQGAALVSGDQRLLCEAQGAGDIERWLRLADEFGLRIGISGGLEAWRVRDVLAAREVPVVLTLDWGKEVKDPTPEEKPAEAKAAEAKDEPGAEKPGEKAESAPVTKAEAEVEGETAAEKEEQRLDYVEPLAVREERRRKWEEGRDCALRLEEAGVRFAFGTASAKPGELLEHVRTLVKEGLSADAAVAALTEHAAELLGVGERLGRVAAGYDATFALWRADPLTDEKASAAWVFVDGFPTEFKEEKKKEKGGAPAKGVDPTGAWELTFDDDAQGPRGAKLVLEMDEQGGVDGTLTVDNPMDGSKISAEVDGQVSEAELEFEVTLAFGDFEIGSTFTGTLDGERIQGEASFRMPGGEEPMTRKFHGQREPK